MNHFDTTVTVWLNDFVCLQLFQLKSHSMFLKKAEKKNPCQFHAHVWPWEKWVWVVHVTNQTDYFASIVPMSTLLFICPCDVQEWPWLFLCHTDKSKTCFSICASDLNVKLKGWCLSLIPVILIFHSALHLSQWYHRPKLLNLSNGNIPPFVLVMSRPLLWLYPSLVSVMWIIRPRNAKDLHPSLIVSQWINEWCKKL